MSTLQSIESLAQFVESLPASPRRIIGIAGSPGAGKSTIAEALVARGPGAGGVPVEGYPGPPARLVVGGRRPRLGAPDTFDVEGFLATLVALRDVHNSGTPVLAPGFDRGIEEPVPAAISILQELSTVVVEGNYLLLESGGWERVAPLLDATVFVRVDRGIRLDRLIERHMRFGKSPADARAWALGPDERNAQLIEATAARADCVVELP